MQKIMVFQQNGSGTNKIDGINRFGAKKFVLEIFDIDESLPPVLDDTSAYLPEKIEADLVLDYLIHRDLSDDLSKLCSKLGIPVVASGKKILAGNAICPPTCCALHYQKNLGDYGRLFGRPEIKVETDKDMIREIRVEKGAPCGATWNAAAKIKNMPVERALTRFGLEVQFFCTADPASWDPLWGKSPVHFAADIHSAVLKAALKTQR
jgi:hypothetical protein